MFDIFGVASGWKVIISAPAFEKSLMKLSTGDKDPSFVREVLSYEIGRYYMDMPQSNYAYIKINGDDYGLYSSSEAINGYREDSKFFGVSIF